MARTEKVFSGDVSKFNISTMSAGVIISCDDVARARVFYDGDIKIGESYNMVSIIEKSNEHKEETVGNSSIIISGNNFFDNSCVTVNGQSISCGRSSGGEVEIILPKKIEDFTFDIKTISGDISIRELFMTMLLARTISGDVKLVGINSLFSKINTISGDINADILESMVNYIIKLRTTSGRIMQRSNETESPRYLGVKNIFDAESTSGDIDISFEGKKK